MVSTGCTRLACYLANAGGTITLPLVTLAGLIDGINPCAISMMVFLLWYLLAIAKKPEKVLITGIIYISTVYITYLSIGLIFYQSLSFLLNSPITFWLNRIIGSILLVVALIQLKDFLLARGIKADRLPIVGHLHLQVPQGRRKVLSKLAAQATLPATILLAILVTLFETPCSLPLYVGTANLLAQSGLPRLAVLAYFAYYNFLFVLPLIIILFAIWKGKELAEVGDWSHKFGNKMRLASVLLLFIFGIWLWIR